MKNLFLFLFFLVISTPLFHNGTNIGILIICIFGISHFSLSLYNFARRAV